MSPVAPRPYRVVDVFTDRLTAGNPLAVVHDADGLDDATMAAFARWTNLSETAFLLTPIDAEADYRVRIFTPGGELPFAGHPTIGSAWAWLAAGGQPRHGDAPVQQCGIGRVPLRRTGGRLAFAAPPLRRTPVAPDLQGRVVRALGLDDAEVLDSTWLDNGPRWLALRLADADRVRALTPDHTALATLAKVGVVAPQPAGADTQVEVRAFAAPIGVPEDPVTGSLNAGLAAWLIEGGHLPRRYVAAQGGALGRAGRVHLDHDGRTLWVGGDVAEGVQGTLRL